MIDLESREKAADIRTEADLSLKKNFQAEVMAQSQLENSGIFIHLAEKVDVLIFSYYIFDICINR